MDHNFGKSVACSDSEKVTIPRTKPNITFQGQGHLSTAIAWNDTANSSHGTFYSGSVQVFSNNFIARNISFMVRNQIEFRESCSCYVIVVVIGMCYRFRMLLRFRAPETWEHKRWRLGSWATKLPSGVVGSSEPKTHFTTIGVAITFGIAISKALLTSSSAMRGRCTRYEAPL